MSKLWHMPKEWIFLLFAKFSTNYLLIGLSHFLPRSVQWICIRQHNWLQLHWNPCAMTMLWLASKIKCSYVYICASHVIKIQPPLIWLTWFENLVADRETGPMCLVVRNKLDVELVTRGDHWRRSDLSTVLANELPILIDAIPHFYIVIPMERVRKT